MSDDGERPELTCRHCGKKILREPAPPGDIRQYGHADTGRWTCDGNPGAVAEPAEPGQRTTLQEEDAALIRLRAWFEAWCEENPDPGSETVPDAITDQAINALGLPHTDTIRELAGFGGDHEMWLRRNQAWRENRQVRR